MLAGDGLHPLAGLARRPAFFARIAVGLRDQAHDLVRTSEEGLEGRFGEQAGSHHHKPHAHLLTTPVARGLDGHSTCLLYCN